MDFIEFIEEAQVSKNNLTKMVKVFSKYMGKKLNKGYYVIPYMVDIKGGRGQEVWLSDWRKIRFNWIQGHIKSITLWDNKKDVFSDKKGSRTIHLNGLNVVQMAKRIVEILKSKSYTGKETHFLEPMYERFQPDMVNVILEKKTRVKPSEFVIMLRDGKVKDTSKVSWNDIERVANANNVNVPGAVRKAPTQGKASNRTYDLSSFMSGDAVKASNNGIASSSAMIEPKDTEKPIEAMDLEVEREDKITIDIPDISDLEKKFADKIAKYDVEQMSDPQYVKFVYDDLENKINAVAQGLNRLLVLVGGPGLGKTFTTTQILKSYGWKKNTGLQTPPSPNELYRVFYMNRNPGDIIVIDDADKILEDSNGVNLFKQAFGDEGFVGAAGSQSVQNISSLTDQEMEEFMASTDEKIAAGEDYKLPHLFQYQGSVIFISNKSKSQFNDAVLSRSQFVNMEFTPQQVWMKIEEILPFMPNDNGQKPDLTDAEKSEVLDVARLFYWKALKKALKDWENAQSGKERKKLMDPREIRPTLRFISKGLLYKEIANKTGAGDTWIANLKSAL